MNPSRSPTAGQMAGHKRPRAPYNSHSHTSSTSNSSTFQHHSASTSLSHLPPLQPAPSSPTSTTSSGDTPPPFHHSPQGPQGFFAPTSQPAPFQSSAPLPPPPSASSFRNVSACNRCRLRKNRCDQRLPACSACEKAGTNCVGFDPITKKEIPRSYVYFLESRAAYLETVLQSHGISYTHVDAFALDQRATGQNHVLAEQRRQAHAASTPQSHDERPSSSQRTPKGVEQPASLNQSRSQAQSEQARLDKLVSNVGTVAVQGTSDARYLGSTSGISFARVVFSAVRSSINSSSRPSSERGVRPSNPASTAAGGTSMRDSFFGLHTRPTIKEAPFPDRDLGLRLVNLYFEHANPQIPILHRLEFMSMFDRVYNSSTGRRRSPRESYLLNIVFAIGSGIIFGSSDTTQKPDTSRKSSSASSSARSDSSTKRKRLASLQHQPEEYHASAIVHLESFLGSSPASGHPDGFGSGLEELQAVLLLAGFALLRPVAPGLWYIVGVAVRLGIDLGLHFEEGGQIGRVQEDENEEQAPSDEAPAPKKRKLSQKEKGRREWVRDLRRRLWWCVYSFDRLVSTCVGRPFGITDQVVTTEFPSLLDDASITLSGFTADPENVTTPSYKRISYHYFRLRLLQSEILNVLQWVAAQKVHAAKVGEGNPYIHKSLPSPFLQDKSFTEWRSDVDRRLWEWRKSAPTQEETGVEFQPMFLELNYWQAVIVLYRQSLTTPAQLADEAASVNDGVSSPGSSLAHLEETGGEEFVYLKIAEAGQKVLKLYRQLHRLRLVNYTFLATHHLFMAGISFLFAIWHSTAVRRRLTLDDVDFTVLAATSVLDDLIEKCAPAEACRDAFSRMSKATISMCMNTTGFGKRDSVDYSSGMPTSSEPQTMTAAKDVLRQPAQPISRRRVPKFDEDLRDLFTEEDFRPFGTIDFRRLSLQKPDTLLPKDEETPTQLTTDLLSQPSQQQQQQQPLFFSNDTPPYGNFTQSMQNSYPGVDMSVGFFDTFPIGGSFSDDAFNEFGTPTPTADGAMDMLGLGVPDPNHDFSDGTGNVMADLMEGFFFENRGNNQF